MDSTTNIITCDKLRSSTGTITINTTIAPTVNQVLIALPGTSESMDHNNLLNIKLSLANITTGIIRTLSINRYNNLKRSDCSHNKSSLTAVAGTTSL